MSAILNRRKRFQTGGIPVSFIRFDTGSGMTLYDWGMELSQSELVPSNINNVSVWLSGSEIPVYVEPLGLWPDGSARTLYIQAREYGIQNVEIPGEVRLTGGYTQPRRIFSDQSLRWINKAWTFGEDYVSGSTTMVLKNNTGATATIITPGSCVWTAQTFNLNLTDYSNFTDSTFTIENEQSRSVTLSKGIAVSYPAGTPLGIDSTNKDDSRIYTFRNGGLPEGVIVSTDPVRLCKATGIGYVDPLSSQISFTYTASYSSSAVDVALNRYYESPGLSEQQSKVALAAIYERGTMIWHRFCRTGDINYLKDFCASTSLKMLWYIDYNRLLAPAEWQVEQITRIMMYLFRRHTIHLDSMQYNAENYYNNPGGLTQLRVSATRWVRPVLATLWAGKTITSAGTGSFPEFVSSSMLPRMIKEGTNAWPPDLAKFDNGRPISAGYYDQFGNTTSFTYPYMAGLYLRSLIYLHDALSDTAARNAIRSTVSKAVDYMLFTSSNLLSNPLSIKTLPAFVYTDVSIWTSYSGTLTQNYIAGDTTISIGNLSGASLTLTSASNARIAFGSESKVPAGTTTVANGATASFTLTTPFTSSIPNGSFIKLLTNVTSPKTYGEVDLNGFVAPIMAWDGWINNKPTSSLYAKGFYAALGATPYDGGSGPYLVGGTKWVTEAFHSAQETLALLAKSS